MENPPFDSVPSPSFLHSKEMKGLAAPPLLRGCLARKKGKRENERKYEASYASFIENELNVYKVLSRLYIYPNSIQITKIYKSNTIT